MKNGERSPYTLPPTNEFGTWLDELALARGVSLTELARLAGADLPYLSQVRRGAKPLGRQGLMRLLSMDGLTKEDRARGMIAWCWDLEREIAKRRSGR